MGRITYAGNSGRRSNNKTRVEIISPTAVLVVLQRYCGN
jgi:hypothetical protein